MSFVLPWYVFIEVFVLTTRLTSCFKHGILGMTDLLKDSSLDNQQVSHVATIETCGKTLLETINHVSLARFRIRLVANHAGP